MTEFNANSVSADSVGSVSDVMKLLLKLSNLKPKYDEQFFLEGNALLPVPKKYGITRDHVNVSKQNSSKEFIHCSMLNCNINLNSVQEYEDHYNLKHRFRCSICKMCLPSDHILDLHLMENHDSYFSVLAAKKPMFTCFLPLCEYKSSNNAERKDHCIKEHKFPANFRFFASKLSTDKHVQKSVMDDGDSMDDLADQFSKSLKLKKKNFYSFGHTQVKAFNFKKGKPDENDCGIAEEMIANTDILP